MCSYQYIEHLLDAEEWHSFTQSNADIEAAITKAWPELVNQLRQDGMDSVSAESREREDKLAYHRQKVAGCEKSYCNKRKCHHAAEDEVKRLHAELEQATCSVPTSLTELSAAINFSPAMEGIDISDPSPSETHESTGRSSPGGPTRSDGHSLAVQLAVTPYQYGKLAGSKLPTPPISDTGWIPWALGKTAPRKQPWYMTCNPDDDHFIRSVAWAKDLKLLARDLSDWAMIK
jgi:hypothetical protein